jgi:hypothetical protein
MRTLSWMEAAYETARIWALQPVSHPPAGWAQIVCRGVASLSRHVAPPSQAFPQGVAESVPRMESELLTLVAAMIAEVCQ